MARGKYAAKAAIRRIEAADAHIDTLTNKVVDAKMRARQNEAAARELPGARAEVARLRRMIEDGTSDKLEAERERHAVELLEANARAVRLVAFIGMLFERDRDGLAEDPDRSTGRLRLKASEWGELSDIVGPLHTLLPEFGKCRGQRRRVQKAASSSDAFVKMWRMVEEENSIEDRDLGYRADNIVARPR